MSDVFEEVDEALKQEKLQKMWEENGNYIISLILCIILGTAAWSGYDYWRVQQAEKSTGTLITIANSIGEETEQENDFSGLKSNQKAMAYLLVARQELIKKNYDSAFDHYLAATNINSADSELKGLATYYARNIILDGLIEQNYEDIATPEGTIWQPFYNIQDAIYLADTKNNLEESIAKLDMTLAHDAKTPEGLRALANKLKTVYSYDHSKANGDKEGDPS